MKDYKLKWKFFPQRKEIEYLEETFERSKLFSSLLIPIYVFFSLFFLLESCVIVFHVEYESERWQMDIAAEVFDRRDDV